MLGTDPIRPDFLLLNVLQRSGGVVLPSRGRAINPLVPGFVIVCVMLGVLISPARADITTGIVGWWKLDDVSGTVAVDASIYHNNGALQNISSPATATSGWAKGRLGGALAFDGSNDYVNVGTAAVLAPASQMTACSWINTIKTQQYIVARWNDGTDIGQVFAFYTWNNKLGSAVNATNQTDNGLYGNRTISDGQWHHVCMTAVSGANGQKLYVDGVLDAQRTPSGTIFSNNLSNSVRIGTSDSMAGAMFFQGLIDDLRIYNRVLTAGDIVDLYNYGRVRIGGGARINELRVY